MKLVVLLLAFACLMLSGCTYKMRVEWALTDQREVSPEYEEEVRVESPGERARVFINGEDKGYTPVTVKVAYGTLRIKQQGYRDVIYPINDEEQDKYRRAVDRYSPGSKREETFFMWPLGGLSYQSPETEWTGNVIPLKPKVVKMKAVYDSGREEVVDLRVQATEKAFQTAFWEAGYMGAEPPEEVTLRVKRTVVLSGVGVEPAATQTRQEEKAQEAKSEEPGTGFVVPLE